MHREWTDTVQTYPSYDNISKLDRLIDIKTLSWKHIISFATKLFTPSKTHTNRL